MINSNVEVKIQKEDNIVSCHVQFGEILDNIEFVAYYNYEVSCVERLYNSIIKYNHSKSDRSYTLGVTTLSISEEIENNIYLKANIENGNITVFIEERNEEFKIVNKYELSEELSNEIINKIMISASYIFK